MSETLASRLRTRASFLRQIKNVQRGKPDRISDLLEEAANALVETRRAFADYKASEGCSCCRYEDAHEEAAKRLAVLLDVPAYPDGIGYRFYDFKTKD